MQRRCQLINILTCMVEITIDLYGGDHDAQCAWQNFGGLTLEEASVKFRQHPEIYQEDFMFMGGKASVYYYPVIDSYLRETPLLPPEDRDDCGTWILPQCIKNQFQGWDDPHVRHIKRDVDARERRNQAFRQGNVNRRRLVIPNGCKA